jgi:hypothetical protein
MTMFVTILPIAGLMLLFTYSLTFRLNVMVLFKLHQRPVPHSAEDIGTWYCAAIVFEQYHVIFITIIYIFTTVAIQAADI